MEAIYFLLTSLLLLVLFIWIKKYINDEYNERFRLDFKNLIDQMYSRNKFHYRAYRLDADTQDELESFFKEIKIRSENKIIDDYKENIVDSVIYSDFYLNTITGYFNEINPEAKDEGEFLKKLGVMLKNSNNTPADIFNDNWIQNEIKERLREDIWDRYRDENKVIDEEDFIEKKKTGIFKSWHFNGQVEKEATYLDGELIEINTWNDDGVKTKEAKMKNGEYVDYYRTWYDNGIMEEEILLDDNQVWIKHSEWFSDGEPSKEKNYKNNKKHGLQMYIHNEGGYKEYYLHGKKHGKCLYYSKGQKPRIEVNYKNGLKHGLFRSYDLNGDLYYESTFVEGDGVLKYPPDRHSHRKLTYVCQEIKGKIVHEQRYYKNGKLEMETFWDGDKILSESFWDENGNPKEIKN